MELKLHENDKAFYTYAHSWFPVDTGHMSSEEAEVVHDEFLPVRWVCAGVTRLAPLETS